MAFVHFGPWVQAIENVQSAIRFQGSVRTPPLRSYLFIYSYESKPEILNECTLC
jgi:hypothetical protein